MSAQAKRAITAKPMSGAVAAYIEKSRQKVTILFTDIQDSTKYWEKHGDLQGRLMVDLHNRLAFPVVRKFGGRIIKTIGDSIMASFKRPFDAVRAAIGIQQILAKAREADRAFVLRVRIGVHTGVALVEREDVFGDVVNTAARVESHAEGDQILVSESAAREVEEWELGLKRSGSFTPKGKSERITVFECPWDDFESLVDDIRPGSYLPVLRREKVAFAVDALAGLALLYFVVHQYLRFVVADRESLALLAFDPLAAVRQHPAAVAVPIAILLLGALLLSRVRAAPHYVLVLGRGTLGFAVAYFGAWLLVSQLSPTLLPGSERVLYASQHGFLEVQEGGAVARERPHGEAPEVARVGAGVLLLQSGFTKVSGSAWDKVLLGRGEWGWVERREPARIGVPEREVTRYRALRFSWRDVYPLVVGSFGFVLGVVRFRIRPL